MALCECGCGQTTKIITRTNAQRGLVRGQSRRFLHGHVLKRIQPSSSARRHGERHPFWRGADATYGSLHARVTRQRGAPQACEHCGRTTPGRYEWDSKTKRYDDLLFRKKGKNPIPIAHPTGLDRYAGERQIPADLLPYKNWDGKQTENRYSHWIWRQYASAFWDDVRIDRVLPYKESKEPDDEKHVHPLQLDVIERVVVLRSNPDEIILTPFMGVGSEVYGAVINGRRGIGIELKGSYYKQAERNLEAAANNWTDHIENEVLAL